MKRFNRPLLLIAAGVLPLAGGCSSNLGDFTVLSTKNIDLTNFRTDTAEKSRTVTGTDSKFKLIAWTGQPSMKEAADKAEESANANALTNARISFSWWDAIFIGSADFTVTGNPVVRK